MPRGPRWVLRGMLRTRPAAFVLAVALLAASIGTATAVGLQPRRERRARPPGSSGSSTRARRPPARSPPSPRSTRVPDRGGRPARCASLGLKVQPMEHLPLALVRGPKARRRVGRSAAGWPATCTRTSGIAVLRHRVVRRHGRGRRPRRGAHRPGRDRRRRRLRLRRQPPRPGRPRRPQREAVRRPSTPTCRPTRATRSSCRSRWARTRTPTSAPGTAPTWPASSPPTAPPAPDHLGVAPDADPRLLLHRRGAVHHRRRHRLRPHARPARPVGHRRGQQLVGQHLPQFDPRDPVDVATKAVADQGVDGRVRGRQLRRRQRRDEPQPVLAGAVGDLGGGRAPSTTSAATSPRTASATTTRSRSRSAPAATRPSPATASASSTPTSTAPGVDICPPATPPAPPSARARRARTPRPRARAWPRPHVAGAAAVLLQANPRSRPRRSARRSRRRPTPVSATPRSGPATARLLAGRLRLRRPDRGRAPGPLGHLSTATCRPSRPRPTSGPGGDGFEVPPLATSGPTTRRAWRSAAPTAAPTRWRCRARSRPPEGDPVAPVAGAVGGNGIESTTSRSGRDGPGPRHHAPRRRRRRHGDRVRRPGRCSRPSATARSPSRSAGSVVSDPDTLDSDSLLGDTITLQVAQLTKQP